MVIQMPPPDRGRDYEPCKGCGHEWHGTECGNATWNHHVFTTCRCPTSIGRH